MPRRRVTFRRAHHPFPSDFPLRLRRFQKASGFSWNQLARNLGTDALTLRRWRAGTRPNAQHLLALLALAQSLGLDHMLTTAPVPEQVSLWALPSEPDGHA